MRKKYKIGLLVFVLVCLFCIMPVYATPGVNDYPYASDAETVDPWNFYKRNCTSFVAWRLNNDNGVPFTNQYLGVTKWGDAKNWASTAASLGIAVDTTPIKGAVACWTTGGQGHGHVAWVLDWDESSVTIEEYNFNVSLGYGTRKIAKGSSGYPQYFIHINDLGTRVTIKNDIPTLYVGETNSFAF